ncbi:MAG: sigma-54-dependent Fis family transcriptional regulator [Endozoicomonadaceae bacterium]|nr:sigma-54-dependent Fis family transcriptional regulator [Endozoicomonadaceae bacterium]
MTKYSVLMVGKTGLDSPVSQQLASLPFTLEKVNNCAAAIDVIAQKPITLIIASDHLPDASTLEFIQQVGRQNPTQPLIIASPDACIEDAVAAIHAGASDFIVGNITIDRLTALLERQPPIDQDDNDPITVSSASQSLLAMAKQVANTNTTVLITGDSGTGKEILARYVHRHSPRQAQAFIAINCAAIPETLLESELFGYVKGAFTGAYTGRPGKFELANEGTLFLDEIGEIAAPLQAKLLRVLQEREVERIGSHRTIRLNIRIIAATNQNLVQRVNDGHFREDLFYRLNVFPLHCQPLRERLDDILPLARHFLRCTDQSLQFSLEAETALLNHDWPGNARELDNVIQRALVLTTGNIIFPEALMLPQIAVTHEKTDFPLHSNKLHKRNRILEQEHIINTLRRHQGNRTRTAKTLDITTRTLRNKLADIRRQGLDIDALIAEPQTTE